MKNEMKIGEIGLTGVHSPKFIISAQGVIFSQNRDLGLRFDAARWATLHRDIEKITNECIRENGYKEETIGYVLGGGYWGIYEDDKMLKLYGQSEDFGGVPHKVIENFSKEIMDGFMKAYDTCFDCIIQQGLCNKLELERIDFTGLKEPTRSYDWADWKAYLME